MRSDGKAEKIKAKDASVSVSGHSVILRKINLPVMSREELDESIQWEAEQYIPFDINDVYIDVAILNEHNDTLKSQGVLFSIHDEDVPVFRLLRMRARRMPGLIEDAKDVLLMLFDADAEYCADTLEDIYDEIETVSQKVLNSNASDNLLSEALSAIARHEDMSGRIRRNVMDTRRAVSFMMRSRLLSAEQFEDARQILRDLDSLDGHTAFLFDKINFLMDATVGFININQNKIIKIFSVASVSLLPPTLVASSYGMNFAFMPELQWQYGYPLALLLMVLSAALPMLYFRKRGWLR